MLTYIKSGDNIRNVVAKLTLKILLNFIKKSVDKRLLVMYDIRRRKYATSTLKIKQSKQSSIVALYITYEKQKSKTESFTQTNKKSKS